MADEMNLILLSESDQPRRLTSSRRRFEPPVSTVGHATLFADSIGRLFASSKSTGAPLDEARETRGSRVRLVVPPTALPRLLDDHRDRPHLSGQISAWEQATAVEGSGSA